MRKILDSIFAILFFLGPTFFISQNLLGQAGSPVGRIVLEEKEALDRLDSIVPQIQWFQRNVPTPIIGTPVRIDEKSVLFRRKDGDYFEVDRDSLFPGDLKTIEDPSLGRKERPMKYPVEAPSISIFRQWERKERDIIVEGELLGMGDGDLFLRNRSGIPFKIFQDGFVEEEIEFAKDQMLVYESKHGKIDIPKLARSVRRRAFRVPSYMWNEEKEEKQEKQEVEEAQTPRLPQISIVKGIVRDKVLEENEIGVALVDDTQFHPEDLFQHFKTEKRNDPKWLNKAEYSLPNKIPADKKVERNPEVSDDVQGLLKRWANPEPLDWKQLPVSLDPKDAVIEIDLQGKYLLVKNAPKEYAIYDVDTKKRNKIPLTTISQGAYVDFGFDPPFLFDNDGESLWMYESTKVSKWNTKTWEKTEELGKWTGLLKGCFSGDGRQFVALDETGVLHLGDFKSGNVRSCPSFIANDPKTECPKFKGLFVSVSGNEVVVGTSDGYMYYSFTDDQHGPEMTALGKATNADIFQIVENSCFYRMRDGATVATFNLATTQFATINPLKIVHFNDVRYAFDKKLTYIQHLSGLDCVKDSDISNHCVMMRDYLGEEFGMPTWIMGIRGEPKASNNDGSVYIFEGGGERTLAYRPPQPDEYPQDQLIKVIDQCIERDDPAQLDAMAQFIRSSNFHTSRDLSEQFYTEFSNLVSVRLSLYRSKDGGDLAERAEMRMLYFLRRMPDSLFFKTVLADHRLQHAWVVRGSGGDTLSEERYQLYQEDLGRALDILRRDVAFDQLSAHGYGVLMSIGNAQGWDRDRMLIVRKKMLKSNARNSINCHFRFLDACLPSWGGSIEECLDYVESVEPFVDESMRKAFYAAMIEAVIRQNYREDPSLFEKLDKEKYYQGLVQIASTYTSPRLVDDSFLLATEGKHFDLAEKVLALKCKCRLKPGNMCGLIMAKRIEQLTGKLPESPRP